MGAVKLRPGAPEPNEIDKLEAALIIAFDAEWVEEPNPPEIDPEDPDEDPGPDPKPPGNIILSYQYACRFVLPPGEQPAEACDWSGIIYTRHAQRLLHPHLSDQEPRSRSALASPSCWVAPSRTGSSEGSSTSGQRLSLPLPIGPAPI